MFIKNITLHMIILIIPMIAFSQESSKKDPERMRHNNVVLTIGHSLIPTGVDEDGSNTMVTIPNWGLSYEYRFSSWFLMGLKGDLEISDYTIKDNEGAELEREYPFALTLYGDFRTYKDLYIYAGPGIEFEKDENLVIVSFGLYYEVEMSKNWSLVPEVSWELKGGHTGAYSIALGVCKSF